MFNKIRLIVPVKTRPLGTYHSNLNQNFQFDTSCKYSKTIGTSYSSSISESMSVDSTVEASIKAEFFKLFSLTLGTSQTTGYKWESVSEAAQSEEVTVTVDAVAPAGYVLTIEQAVGACQDGKVKTEMYKITHSKPDGSLVQSKIVTLDQLSEPKFFAI